MPRLSRCAFVWYMNCCPPRAKVVKKNLPNSWQRDGNDIKRIVDAFPRCLQTFEQAREPRKKNKNRKTFSPTDSLKCGSIFLVSSHSPTPASLLATYLGASFIKANLPKSSPVFRVATVPLPCITTSTEPLSKMYQERPSSP